MNTYTMTLNFNIPNPSQPQSLLRAQQPDSLSLPLRQHPKWMPFVQLCGRTLLMTNPEVRVPFLELLDQADLL